MIEVGEPDYPTKYLHDGIEWEFYDGGISVGGPTVSFENNEYLYVGEVIYFQFDRFDADVTGNDGKITVCFEDGASSEFVLNY